MPLLPGLLLPELVVSVWVLYISKIELFNDLLRIIINKYLKQFSWAQII